MARCSTCQYEYKRKLSARGQLLQRHRRALEEVLNVLIIALMVLLIGAPARRWPLRVNT